jgi:hypothetical protein
LDIKGNIIDDQYNFPYDIWKEIVSVSLEKQKPVFLPVPGVSGGNLLLM